MARHNLLHRWTFRWIMEPTLFYKAPSVVVHFWAVQTTWSFPIKDIRDDSIQVFPLKRHDAEEYLNKSSSSMSNESEAYRIINTSECVYVRLCRFSLVLPGTSVALSLAALGAHAHQLRGSIVN